MLRRIFSGTAPMHSQSFDKDPHGMYSITIVTQPSGLFQKLELISIRYLACFWTFCQDFRVSKSFVRVPRVLTGISLVAKIFKVGA